MRHTFHILTLLVSCLLAMPAFAAPAATPAKETKDVTNNSGLPIPRFAALKSAEVNVRTGPGSRYPIQWVYRRDQMPVEVIEEYDLWRKIRDVEGGTGWVHKTMLGGTRTIMVRGKKMVIVRREPDEKGKPILKAEPMVIAKLVECEKFWCRIQVQGRKGWLEKANIFGVYAKDVFE